MSVIIRVQLSDIFGLVVWFVLNCKVCSGTNFCRLVGYPPSTHPLWTLPLFQRQAHLMTCEFDLEKFTGLQWLIVIFLLCTLPCCEGRQQDLQLLPPSEFEKPKGMSQEPCQDWKKSSEEILALKLENQRLRYEVLNTSDSSQPQVALTHRSVTSEERRYADELISRQAEEIIKLKAQAQRLECEQRSMRDQYQEKLAALELEKETRVAALSDKLLRQNHEYEQQVMLSAMEEWEVIRLSEEHEGEVDDLQARLEHLSADLEQTKDRLTSQVADLTQELQAEREQSHSTEESLQQNLREKDAALQNAAHEVRQLRTYITESEQRHRPQEVWQKECETLENKLKIAEVEKQNLESSVQLMDVRLSSMKEILSTQEAELSKGKEETIDKNKLKELLLTRWRQKVYALLVQQKSSDLVSRKDLQNWQEKTSTLEDKLSSAYNTVSILQHTVAEREAEIQLGVNTTKKLQEELSQAQQMALSLDDKMAENRSDVERLADFAHSCEERFGPQCQVLQQAMTQLKSLGQRVSFASSRMELVKSQLLRREALKQLERTRGLEKAKADVDTEDSWRVDRQQFVKELERVRNERDLLTAQLKHDSEMWSEKTSSMRSQYDTDVGTLKKTVEDLELVNQEKSRTIEQLTEALEEKKSELTETAEYVETLRTEVARQEHTMMLALEDQRNELKKDWAEQMAEMERKLNDARREHTKAVVTVRQLERQMGRERERTQELQATMEAHNLAQLTHLQQQLQAVEKERNIFMATLRQEGLLGRLKSERGEPIRLQLQEEAEEQEASYSVTEVTETESQPPQDTSEPVSAVLEDLKALAPAVLDDTEESSDENQ
ncbi:hypothetical protein BaRGS_00011700 [Batillaria attramentaria]|uniref:Coiled-coil alpha-helical rod protein 1 n=1 Tax=Batillaria attramentaria TaxID=370345 RepID=A0ABD0LBT2_9CAEN